LYSAQFVTAVMMRFNVYKDQRVGIVQL